MKMDTSSDPDTSIPAHDDSLLEESDKVLLPEINGEVTGESGNVFEFLRRLELNLAFLSEKTSNLGNLMMYVATRESECEAFVSQKDDMAFDSVGKVLEFNLFCGILDSEVLELDKFIATLQTEIINAREVISLCNHLEDNSTELGEKLRDSEQSLKQSQDLVSDIRMQSTNLQRTFSCLNGEKNWNGEEDVIFIEDDQSLNANAKVKMQTTEGQRHILRMLEKSLATEMELEKKYDDSRQIEEELRLRICTLEQELLCMEEEARESWERRFEADNACEILLGIARGLDGQLQSSQLNLNGLHSQIREMGIIIDNLREKLSESETRADNAEANCGQLTETNKELNEEMALLRGDVGASEKVKLLERQLQELDIRLQQAVASTEASEEKQTMLYSTIRDMEKLIEDLKLKVSKSASRAESAEDNCIVLSESNAELNEELSFLRSRLAFLENSVHHAEETKMAMVKNIGSHTKFITDLVMQLATERERLNKKVSTLMMENKNLVEKLQQAKKEPAEVSGDYSSSIDSLARETKQGISGFANGMHKNQKDISKSDNEAKIADSMPDVGTVRIDAGVLNLKHIVMAILILLVSAAAYLFQQQNNLPF